MKLYEIIGRENSEFTDAVFGQFTTKELAEKGYKKLPEEFQDETIIRQSNLDLNTINVDDKVIDLTETNPEDIIAARDENNYVTGYVQLHIEDIIHNDYESLLDLLSERLTNSILLMDINYDVVAIKDVNEIIFKVSGDVSAILNEEV